MNWKEKEFEEKMTPFIDDIYWGLFGKKLSQIYRSERGKERDARLLFMDQELAIDTHLRFNDGSVLTFQEKSRRYEYFRFNDFTFEYYNDPRTGEKGEWFKLAAQYYFYGYATRGKDGFHKFYILNIPKMRVQLTYKVGIERLEAEFLNQNKPPARANFFGIPFPLLERLPGVVVKKGQYKDSKIIAT